MAELFVVKRGGVLLPFGDEDERKIMAMKAGAMIRVKYSIVRNTPFHKKFYAMLKVAFDAFSAPEDMKSFDTFRKDLIVMAGFYTLCQTVSAGVVPVAKSISFSNMDEAEFAEVYNAVHCVICEKVLEGVDPAEIDAMINEVMGFI